MVELVDTTDLKSVARMGVRVQVPLGVPLLLFLPPTGGKNKVCVFTCIMCLVGYIICMEGQQSCGFDPHPDPEGRRG